MDIFTCVNVCAIQPFLHIFGCSFHALQIVVTIKNIWALFLHVDKFTQASWLMKSAKLMKCKNFMSTVPLNRHGAWGVNLAYSIGN